MMFVNPEIVIKKKGGPKAYRYWAVELYSGKDWVKSILGKSNNKRQVVGDARDMIGESAGELNRPKRVITNVVVHGPYTTIGEAHKAQEAYRVRSVGSASGFTKPIAERLKGVEGSDLWNQDLLTNPRPASFRLEKDVTGQWILEVPSGRAWKTLGLYRTRQSALRAYQESFKPRGNPTRSKQWWKVTLYSANGRVKGHLVGAGTASEAKTMASKATKRAGVARTVLTGPFTSKPKR